MHLEEIELALDAHVRALDATAVTLAKTRARLNLMLHAAECEARAALIADRRYLPQFVGLTFKDGVWS